MKYLLLFTTLLFAGELEVDGGLTVTEGVNASSFIGDGSGLTNLPSLGDMKPERIYRFINDVSTFSFTVPEGKIWYVHIATGQIRSQGRLIGDTYYIFIQNDVIESRNTTSDGNNYVFFNIYEYSISGSGTDQGMDYIEP